VRWWVSSVVAYSLACAAGGALVSALFTSSFVLPLLSGVALGFAPTGYLMIMRGQRFAQCTKILPDAVDLMARSLRAGHALNSALEMVSSDIAEPLSSEFRTVYEEQSLGLPLRDALDNLLQRIPSADLEFLAAALLLQKETGGNLAQILDKTSSLMRDRVRLRGQIRTHTAQARVSGWVLGVLPFVMFVAMNLLNPGYESILLNDPIGIKLIYAGFVMLGVGALVIRKIVDIQI
jgi:tight adherence protein B